MYYVRGLVFINDILFLIIFLINVYKIKSIFNIVNIDINIILKVGYCIIMNSVRGKFYNEIILF